MSSAQSTPATPNTEPTPTTPTRPTAIKAISPPPSTVRDVSAIYSHAVTTTQPTRLITTAGQVGSTPDSTIPSDPATQARLAFANLKHVLAAAGAEVSDVMKLTYYIVGYDWRDKWHVEPLMEFLGHHRPAITSLGVQALARPEYLFEVEAVAAVPF